jgi:hypothetical protein
MVSNQRRFAEIGMNRTIVLNVRMRANPYGRHVASQHGVKPDAGVVTDGDIADDHRRGGDEHMISDDGSDSIVTDYHNSIHTPVHMGQRYFATIGLGGHLSPYR